MLRALGERIRLRSIVASAPLFGLAAVFLAVCVFRFTFSGRVTEDDLAILLAYELILIHAFPFLGLLALVRPERARGKIARFVSFWGLFALYVAAAYGTDGLRGIGVVLALGLATYGGLFPIASGRERIMGQIGLRWVIATCTLIFGICAPIGAWVMIVQGRRAPAFEDYPVIGVFFFAALGFFELFRLYEALIPLEKRIVRA